MPPPSPQQADPCKRKLSFQDFTLPKALGMGTQLRRYRGNVPVFHTEFIPSQLFPTVKFSQRRLKDSPSQVPLKQKTRESIEK